MTTGRMIGDRMADRFGIQRVLAASGILISTGLGITVFSNYIPLTMVAYLLTGFGVSCVVPFVFSLAGRSPCQTPEQHWLRFLPWGIWGFYWSLP